MLLLVVVVVVHGACWELPQNDEKKARGGLRTKIQERENKKKTKKKAGRPEGLHEDWPTADTLSKHNGRHRALSFSP